MLLYARTKLIRDYEILGFESLDSEILGLESLDSEILGIPKFWLSRKTQVFRGHATPERTPTRLKLIFRSANGNSASTSEVKKTRLLVHSQNLGFRSQKLEFGSQILGNPKISEN